MLLLVRHQSNPSLVGLQDLQSFSRDGVVIDPHYVVADGVLDQLVDCYRLAMVFKPQILQNDFFGFDIADDILLFLAIDDDEAVL